MVNITRYQKVPQKRPLIKHTFLWPVPGEILSLSLHFIWSRVIRKKVRKEENHRERGEKEKQEGH